MAFFRNFSGLIDKIAVKSDSLSLHLNLRIIDTESKVTF